MEVAADAPWEDMFESERKQVSGEAETLLSSSNPTLTPLVADSASVRRSQPIFITSNRYERCVPPPNSCCLRATHAFYFVKVI